MFIHIINCCLLYILQTTKRIIDDHKPLVEDLQSSGYELAEICSDDDGSTVRSVVDDIAGKYERVRQNVRDKVNTLDDALRNVTSDVSYYINGRSIIVIDKWQL